MNETLKQFKEIQKRNQENLEKLLDFVKTGEKYGIKIEESFKAKINSAIQSVAKLRVALVGGFSEENTSIAAAWIERLDESMKIDHEIELVDTPGLFGFKEKIADSGKIEHYRDITKKYVSEAHLILYALNPSNPIKESHKDDLNWLFRTLNLLSRTIFVISRFDEEADIEDEEDYNKRFKIKKENIQNRLNDLISLSEKEKEGLSIVAVAANPFNEGLEHWLKHKEEFQKLSHIKTLQDATQKKIKENGGKLTIIEEAKKSVIQDVVYKQMPLAKKEQENLKRELEDLNKAMEKRRKGIQNLKGEISQARTNLREFITRYFSGLIAQVSGTSLETISDFVMREIGDKGINMETRVQNAFERETQGIYDQIKLKRVLMPIGVFLKNMPEHWGKLESIF
ncbi:hypothetical protein JP0018_09820 [Helicobacter pylori]